MPLSTDVIRDTINSGYIRPIDTVSIATEGLKTPDDATKRAIYAALHVTDWAQTRTIARNPEKHSENNPVLGQHPHQDKVDAYFALTGLTKLYLDDKLPKRYQKSFQDLMIGIEKGAVGNNIIAGIKTKF